VNLVKADSYISNKEDGEARLKHLISAYRENNSLPKLTEDGSAYADGIEHNKEPMTRRSTMKSFIHKKRHHHEEGI
jgi:hypothetical protein